MSKIYYAIAWYFNIPYQEAIKEYEDMSNEMLEAIWYRYEAYIHHADILPDEDDDDEPEEFTQLLENKEEYYVEV